MKAYVNHGHPEMGRPELIKTVEEKRNAKFVCYSALKSGGGGWTEECYTIFYQAVKPQPEFSHYFGIIVRGGNAYITGAGSLENHDFGAMLVKSSGEIIYSRYRHDYRTADTDDSVSIDGGRDYVRSSVNANAYGVTLNLVDGELKVIDDSLLLLPNIDAN